MPPLGKAYTLDDFSKLIFAGNQYVLPPSVIAIFQTIESNIDIPVFTQTTTHSQSASASSAHSSHKPSYKDRDRERNDSYRHTDDHSFSGKHSSAGKSGRDRDADHHHGHGHGRGRGGRKETTSMPPQAEDWALMRTFKTTKIEAKTGVDKIANDLRTQINKMSAANYAKQRDVVLQLLRTYFGSEEVSPENTEKLSASIFQMMCSNKVLSELYATLYSEIVAEFSVFVAFLDSFVATFRDTIHTIEYVNPDENYDEFCRITKNNDRRKNTALFIVNIMKQKVLTPESLMSVLKLFMDYVDNTIREADRSNHVEELVENIYIIVSGAVNSLKALPEWESVFATMKGYAGSQVNQYPSMSNRILFKFMDIIDSIAKK
jgi:hypothetical protein